MNRDAVKWIVGAILVLGLAPVTVIFGMTLLPSMVAAQKGGTLVPWTLTWGMIWMTALIAVALAGLLVRVGVSQARSE
jgi:hypothetical protein